MIMVLLLLLKEAVVEKELMTVSSLKTLVRDERDWSVVLDVEDAKRL